MSCEKVKLVLAFNGLIECITQEQEEYIVKELKNHFTNEEVRKIYHEIESSEVEFDELVQSLIQDFKNVLFK